MSRGESKGRLVLKLCRMKTISMGRIPSAVLALEKSYPLVSNQLHPRSRAPIGVSSYTAASSSMAALGPLLVVIVTGTSRALIHIRSPVARDLRFIARLLTI